jgi:antitoxin ParD1/3/4
MTAQLTFSLPPELVAKVRGAVSSGDYGGVSEVMREAIRDWARKRAMQALETGAVTRKQSDAA